MHEHVVQQRENFQNLSKLICSSVEGMLNEPVFPFLDKITQPTLCIYGQLETAIPNRWLHPQMTVHQVAQTAKEKIKDCRMEMFALAGHYLPVDQAEELAKEIRQIV
jgi:pimeloyl-ACP methyl ester carboxylesterase